MSAPLINVVIRSIKREKARRKKKIKKPKP
jgi:hypothetical protein